MLILTIQVDAPATMAQGIKERMAMDLEKYGDVKVVSIEEKNAPAPSYEQLGFTKTKGR